MSAGRSRLILAAIAGADSTWLFALFSVLGLTLGLGGSPLPWLTVFLVLFASILSGYVFAGTRGEDATLAIWEGVAGVIVIYLLMGTGSYIEGSSFDIGWIVRLVSGGMEAPQVVSAIFALIVSLWLWRRGMKLATDRYPEDHLSRIFKIGIAVLAVTVLVDEAADADLSAGVLLVPFFAAALVGLAVGRLPEGGGKSGAAWARTIAVSVLGVMGFGMLLGLVGGVYGGGGVKLLFAGWGVFVDGVLWVLRYPITGLVMALDWLFSRFAGREQEVTEPQGPGRSAQEILGIDPEQASEGGSQLVDTLVNILQYPVIILLVVAVFFFLALAFRRFGRRGDDEGEDERESIRGDADAAGDMARLLRGLVPGWLRGKEGKEWRYPDQPGIAEVFQLYFKTIGLGMKWGMEFDPNMTPAERLPLLQVALPGAPVQQVTDRFNAACYGREPTPAHVVSDLEARLDAAERDIRRR